MLLGRLVYFNATNANAEAIDIVMQMQEKTVQSIGQLLATNVVPCAFPTTTFYDIIAAALENMRCACHGTRETIQNEVSQNDKKKPAPPAPLK
jgi:hypothetical protein